MIKNSWLIFALALSAQLSAQESSTTSPEAASRPLLNSERIAQEFGSYGVAVLESDDRVRVSNLYSLRGETKICRTYAVVYYPDATDAAVSVERPAADSRQRPYSSLSPSRGSTPGAERTARFARARRACERFTPMIFRSGASSTARSSRSIARSG